MSVYVDKGAIAFRGMKMCHMIADTFDELHAMAAAIGLQRRWFQSSPPASFPHYDVSQSKRAEAVTRGAIECDRNAIVAHMRRLRPVFGVFGPGNPVPGLARCVECNHATHGARCPAETSEGDGCRCQLETLRPEVPRTLRR